MSGPNERFPGVLFHNAQFVEVQENVHIGEGTRIGSFTLIHDGHRGRGWGLSVLGS